MSAVSWPPRVVVRAMAARRGSTRVTNKTTPPPGETRNRGRCCCYRDLRVTREGSESVEVHPDAQALGS